MGIKKRKNESGAAVAFISRGKALKKLQLSLLDFRRLCILKGIYPHEPKHLKKAGKGSSAPVTYYYTKDIIYLMHEPILKNIRDYKVFVRKLKKAADKKDSTREKILRSKKPVVTLDHIVKERYPTLIDALRDLDDALSFCFLFAKMPKNIKVHSEQTRMCRYLTIEFLNYIIVSRSLKKVFISIKGYYLQAEIMGQKITWLMPHNVAYEHPKEVDYRVMSTFVEFSVVLLGFVNFALYKSAGIHYPPKIGHEEDDATSYDYMMEVLSSLTSPLKESDELDDLDLPDSNNVKNLFNGLKFFINREVDREIFTFIIRSFGGEVSWCKSVQPTGATYDESDKDITHHIVDRPLKNESMKMGRKYVQPQWIVDSINAEKLLPENVYAPGVSLPPHYSPFVTEESEVFNHENVTADVETVENDMGAEPAEHSDEEKVTEGKPEIISQKKIAHMKKQAKDEERKLAEMSIHKKNKRLYNKLKYMEKMKRKESSKLEEKRKLIKQKKLNEQ